MFEAIKIIKKCKKFLKKYNIPFKEEFHIYKKLGLIHCKERDWRGPIEVNGFPVLIEAEAIKILILSCLHDYYFNEELKNREQLKNNYPQIFGKYDTRKYPFEKILMIYKNFDYDDYKQQVKKYTKYLNINRDGNSKWIYDYDKESFIKE